ncbi:EAL and HDOD domain-containing protein [Idiomarina xiamenensis]|uniref:Intracellular signaling protein n=1 Tax=Idiomarina xiamenensis 10-D-4 TaxID=740709 RepID=K2KCP8_9GAMM|nr:HDOD domain-containing protein [Idiomarina xiamenensis]EKE84462.1 intracellular signaling protein [Idiomarina xiamenensis 10-D-4]
MTNVAYSYIARQPILDRHLQVYGYELLFRDSEQNTFPNIDPDEATSRLLLQQHLLGDINTVCLGKKAFINFHARALIENFPSFLSADDIWIELLETVDVTDELIDACQKSINKGYRIALDDYDFSERWQRILPNVSLVKIDISQQGLAIADKLHWFKQRGLPTLAERVETRAEFEACMALGFDFFQGYFFERPKLLQARSLHPSKLATMSLLAEVLKPELDFSALAKVIQRDVSLTYSLLKLVNSAAFNFAGQISHVQHALTYLGERQLRRYLTLVLTANMAAEQAEELIIKAITRARFLELLCSQDSSPLKRHAKHADAAFMVGMLSLLDAILQLPMADILQQLPLSSALNAALLKRQGDLGELLIVAEDYEHGHWLAVDQRLAALAIDNDAGQRYIDASQWCRMLLLAQH